MTKTIDRHLETISNVSDPLAAELDEPGAELYWAAEFESDFRTGNGIQIAYYADVGRAGLQYVGSGSAGLTAWTDCASAQDALRRYLDNELIS